MQDQIQLLYRWSFFSSETLMPYVFAIKITGLESYRAIFLGTIPQYHTQTTTLSEDLRQALHEM
jgi:hypothetical protein